MRKPAPSRILFINRVYPPQRGATGRLLRDLARALAQDGWDVTVLATGAKRQTEKDGDVTVVRRRGADKPEGAAAYAAVIARLGLAVLILPRGGVIVTMTDPPLAVVAGRALAWLKGARHIHWCQDLYPDLLPALGYRTPPLVMRLLLNLSRGALKRCDHVVAIGRCMEVRLAAGGVDARRLSVIANWPDASLVFGEQERRSRPRDYQLLETPAIARPAEDLHRDSDPKFRVLYAGTLGRAHPAGPILDAAAELAQTNPEIEFIFAGDGGSFDRLARERGARGLENIRLLPFQPESRLRELMESGDVHLISMVDTAAGLLVPSKLYAALAAARPCIFVGPAASEAARTIEAYGAGTVVPQNAPAQLAAAIRHYRDHPDAWFAAHQGALRAGAASAPQVALAEWLRVVRAVAERKVKVRRAK